MARNFFEPSFREAVKSAIAEVERRTSAEIVVAVRPRSASYRHTSIGMGSAIAFVVLCVFLYHPDPFDFTFLPLELIVSFMAGATLTASLPPLQRLLVPRGLMQSKAELAARAAFVELGVHDTLTRGGVLVFVSAFEKRAIVVTDVGVPVAEMGAPFVEGRHRLDAAVRGSPEAFIAALRELGAMLGRVLPRGADDTNELPDGVAEVRS